MRLTDFLRTTVLLFAGAATALAIVALAGATRDEDRTLIYVAVIWWGMAAVIGAWLGRGLRPSGGIARMMANARATSTLPEVEPGTVLVNRLWPLGGFTLVAGGVAFLIPQVPAIGGGYVILLALAWRRQSSAVEAIEGRDGVRFYVEPGSPFKPTRLIRTPGFRRIEPE